MADCQGRDWDPIESASSYSALAAVLAGFVFTGIIVIVTERTAGRDRLHSLTLFLGALVALGFGSYLYALTAGEFACLRAWSVSMVASGLLGLGAVTIFVGLAWLFDTYVGDDIGDRVALTTAAICFGVALAVGALLAVTFAGYWGDSYGSVPGWLHLAVALYGLAIAGTMTALFVRWYRSPVRPDDAETDAEAVRAAVGRAVRTGGAAAAAYTIISAVLTGVVVYIPNQRWDPVPNRVLPGAVGLLSLLAPTVVLVLQVLALPRRRAAASGPAETPPP